MENIFLDYKIRMFRKQSLVLFFSIYNTLTFCSVRAISRLLITRLSNYFNLENNGFPSSQITDCFSVSSSCSFTHNIILFSHPALDKKGFLSDYGTIYPRWWKNQPPVKFLFALTCQGATILKQTQWNNTFEFWVSFRDNVYFIINRQEQQSIIGNFFLRLSKKIHDVSSKEEFYQTIKLEYLNMIEAVDSGYT